ncbi:hypothetical protein J7W19_08380 [Streptomyces mobaraensis NBRC 13819 = DSM 40847]|uniref:DUF308 domain-containing protein n=2 Tax=Streptomyces mobaraensis TaxID=35621 RepID=A0A5N5W734_STRMB|nr:hypothetical protein [Streptomyces mobaraensis]EME98363.1 hypothetical protein H340_21881 [Streptomyces mobaraensis NBRC 13819 = DSM 40847]KAB7842830.1 hypothetical protein FRZ00_19345 [Streptomyces mobaraensis]QTT73435.1 hypothetical protein J7W19_08380 [Streptomyces mobaraensis NBRC 13819 = DSM 40847]
MAERDAGHDRDDSRDPLDEDAAWAELVAAYGEQPDPEKGRWPATGDDEGPAPTAAPAATEPPPAPDAPARPGGFIVYAPGVGPRDTPAPDPLDEDDDEGHFIPPEPPPLPTGDVTSRFAWIAVLGGPLLLLIMVLLRQELTWWITTLGIGGFLGGFATLVLRMRDGDEDEDDPGRGAVV